MVKGVDVAWAAGFLEGEGSFSTPSTRKLPQVQAAQVDRWPLERLQGIFGGNIYACRFNGDGARRRPYFQWQVAGSAAAEVMMTILPMMSPRRAEQIER